MNCIEHRNLVDLDADYLYQQWRQEQIEEMINKLHTLAEQLEQYTSSEAYTEAERNSIFTPIDMLSDAIEQLDL